MSNNVFPIYIAKSKISGKGSFASRNIKKAEVINIIGGTEYSEGEVDDLIEKGKLRADDDFQIGEDKFLIGPGKDYFTNHSCDPNAGIKNVKQIVAIRDIKRGEEITIDYSTVSALPNDHSRFSNENWLMTCNCGSLICRKEIRYIGMLPKETLLKYLRLGIIPEFIRKSLMT